MSVQKNDKEFNKLSNLIKNKKNDLFEINANKEKIKIILKVLMLK